MKKGITFFFNDNGSHRNRKRITGVLQRHGAFAIPYGNASLGSRNKSWSGKVDETAYPSLKIELGRLNCTRIIAEHEKASKEKTSKQKSFVIKGEEE